MLLLKQGAFVLAPLGLAYLLAAFVAGTLDATEWHQAWRFSLVVAWLIWVVVVLCAIERKRRSTKTKKTDKEDEDGLHTYM